MAAIEWTESDSVGIASIDEQHKRLIEITNQLFQAILDDRGRSVVFKVLKDLAEYVDYHFSYEEELLSSHGYPAHKLDAHIREHRALTKRVHEFIEEVKSRDTLDLKVFDFLRTWTSEHLNDTDREYSDFLISKGVE